MSKKLSPDKRKKILFLLGYVLVACLVVFIIRPAYFVSILIVLAPPCLANFLWLKKSKTKIFIFSVITTLLFAPAVELALRLANAWDVQSIFSRPFGLIPWENMIFAFINFFWGVSFYEYFVDKENDRISKKIKYLVEIFVIFSAAVFNIFFYNQELLKASYFGMAIITLVIPAGLIFYQNPHLLKKTLLPTAFFAVVFFIYEITSLYIGSWWWPGNYLFTFNIFGKVFPLDDIIIWYLLSTPALIAGYEYFADDDK